MTINYCCYGMYADVGHSADCPNHKDSAKSTPTHQQAAEGALTDLFLSAMEWGRDYWASFSMRGADKREVAEQFAEKALAALAQPVKQEPAEWSDADADAARLALELECLLTDKDVPASTVSRWWDSAHEALALHRKRLSASTASTASTASPTQPTAAQAEALSHARICRNLGDAQADVTVQAALWDAAALLEQLSAQPQASPTQAQPTAAQAELTDKQIDAVIVQWRQDYDGEGTLRQLIRAALRAQPQAAQAVPQDEMVPVADADVRERFGTDERIASFRVRPGAPCGQYTVYASPTTQAAGEQSEGGGA